MKLMKTVDAVGHVLCHDMTQIIPGEYKDARFRKGHVVTPEDIPVLLSMGKENLYVWECRPGMLHENDAAARWQEMEVVGFVEPERMSTQYSDGSQSRARQAASYGCDEIVSVVAKLDIGGEEW